MHKYRLVAKKGEGTFSEVLKAQCIKNGKYVAIKCMKNHFDSLDQVNNLREIQALRRLSPHANIIKLQEVLYDQPTGRLALVFELMDMNIYELIRGRRHYVAEDRVKNYMYQLMKAMDHMHRNGIFHRDIKPENILIMDDCLKLADFGSCRGIYSKQPYTEYISTRWYRAPECLLTDGYYNYKMDMWGVGCVFFEIMSLFPLFPGTNELDQIQKIHNILGTPPPELLAKMKKRSQHMDFNFPAKEGTGIAKLIPHVAPDCVDLIIKLLAYNPDDRLSARQALRHPYFREIRDAEKRQKALNNPEFSAALSAQPSAASMGHIGIGLMSGNQMEDVKSARHHQGSPAGSEDTSANAHTMSPPETSRMTEHNAALPSISKISHGYSHSVAGNQGLHAGHLSHAHGTLGAQSHHTGTHDTSHHHDDGLDAGNSYRLPGLHAESSIDAMSQVQGEGGLPPIGNLTLGKVGMAGAGGARRGLPNYYDGGAHGVQATSYGKGKPVAGMVKRQGMPGQVPKYVTSKSTIQPGSGVGQVAIAGHKMASSGMQDLTSNPSNSSSYKFKSSSKHATSNAKYMRPIRQLADAAR